VLATDLNDVLEGGGTRFTDLPRGEVLFQPQKGKAILWPSVLADQPHAKDDRTHHEALPVLRGEKYGANFWIHQYDFKNAYAKGCTAS
jgi:prolyl 4-hydroxylase